MKAKLTALLFLTLSTQILAAGPFRKDTKVDYKNTTPTTTSTTTTTPSTTATSSANDAEESSDSKEEKSESTKNSKLTGIPQLDYIYDPNLPRELRGYNLSSYPFFSSVPPEEDIHFKCDGLHDGFYASIEHKCQIYHHCVYGIRHDFLCANFTAFDQKTFICHFVSDVDCEGSKKYWNRNDDLYMATTTTSTTTTTTEPPPTMRRRPVRPIRPIRRPLKRRPIDDYYYDQEYDEDYYEEPLNRRRPSSRTRPKQPLLDYEEEIIPDTGRRTTNKRNRYRDEIEEEEDYDLKPQPKPVERRKLAGRQHVDERRSFAEDRYSTRRRQQSTVDLDAAEVRDDKPQTSPKPLEEFITPKAAGQSVYARPRVPPRIARPVPVNEKNKYQYPVKKSGAKEQPLAEPEPEIEEPLEEEYYDEEAYVARGRRRRIQDKRYRNESQLPRQQNSRVRNQLRKPVIEPDYDSAEQDFVPPVSSSRRPVGRRRSSLIAKQPVEDIDFEDLDYYSSTGKQQKQHQQPMQKAKISAVHRASEGRKKLRRPIIEKEVEDVDTLDAIEEEPAAYELDDSAVEPEQGKSAAKAPYVPVRVVKRPFLPSRGGSPYLPRGLQAVGQAPKWLGSLHQQRPRESVEVASGPNLSSIRMLEHGALVLRHTELTSQAAVTSAPRRHLPLSMPAITQQTVNEQLDMDDNNDYNLAQNQQQSQQQQQQHQQQEQQPKSNAQVTLDMLYENDYDVTINDALNPTLKPLSQHHDHSNYAPNVNYASSSTYSSTNASSKKFHSNIKNASGNSPSSSASSSSSVSSSSSSSSGNAAIGTANNNHIVKQNHLGQKYHNNNQNNHNYKSDSNFSSTDLRRRAILKTASNTQAAESIASTTKSIVAEEEPIYDDEFEY